MSERDVTTVVDAAEAADENQRFDLLHELREHEALDAAQGADAFRAARLLAGSGDPSDLPAVARLSLQAHQDGFEGAGLIQTSLIKSMHSRKFLFLKTSLIKN